jgi:hypothetical protein
MAASVRKNSASSVSPLVLKTSPARRSSGAASSGSPPNPPPKGFSFVRGRFASTLGVAASTLGAGASTGFTFVTRAAASTLTASTFTTGGGGGASLGSSLRRAPFARWARRAGGAAWGP